MLIPVSVERFPICEVRCRCPTMYRCIVFLSAQMRTIFRLNTVVPPSFPTSLLPRFLNYDWQGGFVFPQLTLLWKMAVSNSQKRQTPGSGEILFSKYVWFDLDVTFNDYSMSSHMHLNILFQRLLIYTWQPWPLCLFICSKFKSYCWF